MLRISRSPQFNNALGPGVGKMFDGRKTAIGTVGLLATTLLPVFFPQLAPLASIISAFGSAVDPGTAGAAAGAAGDAGCSSRRRRSSGSNRRSKGHVCDPTAFCGSDRLGISRKIG